MCHLFPLFACLDNRWSSHDFTEETIVSVFHHYFCFLNLMFKLFSMWRVQKKVSNGLKVLQYYTTKPWVFKTENFQALDDSLCDTDKDTFYMDTSKVILLVQFFALKGFKCRFLDGLEAILVGLYDMYTHVHS